MTENVKAKKEVIEKILKLLELSNRSDKVGEADTARRMAQRLLLKHDLEVGDLTEATKKFEKEIFDTGKTSVDKFGKDMAYLISKFHGVYMLYRKGCRNWSNSEYILWGRKSDIENSVYMFEILTRQMHKAKNEASKQKMKTYGRKFNRADMNGFYFGFLAAIGERLEALKQHVQEGRSEMGLVPIPAHVQLLALAKESYEGNPKAGRSSKVYVSQAGKDSGYNAGQKASITKGVEYTNKQLRIGV